LKFNLVELLGYYSNLVDWAEKLDRLPELTGQRQEPILHGVVRRLKPDEIDALVRAYEGGATVYELATRFKIHRTTVSEHLHHQGVKMRWNRPSTTRRRFECY
jgi:DNA invertase Pin-like site-specific DNA recombinase